MIFLLSLCVIQSFITPISSEKRCPLGYIPFCNNNLCLDKNECQPSIFSHFSHQSTPFKSPCDNLDLDLSNLTSVDDRTTCKNIPGGYICGQKNLNCALNLNEKYRKDGLGCCYLDDQIRNSYQNDKPSQK